MVLRHGKPTVAGYSVLHEGFVGVIGDGGVQQVTYANIEKATDKTDTYSGPGGWLGFTDKYWGTAIIPEQTEPIDARFTASGNSPAGLTTRPISSAPRRPSRPATTVATTTRVFAGAKEVGTIDNYGTKLGIKKFDLMIDWGWFYFITKPLFLLIDAIYKFVGNFGVAILIVTVLVKLAFFPLANRSYQSMAKMKKIQPQIAALKETYPDDKMKQQQAQMELFKKEGVNPVAGCLPMVIQIPVFFALYKVIFITIEMRHAPFFGWIKDLSAPDPTNVFTLFGLIPWEPTALPVFGHFLALGVWPLVMGVSMFFQMKMNPEPADPVQKSMFAWMPVIFTFMLGTFPAGLVIYWTWNNTLTILAAVLHHEKGGREGRAVRQRQEDVRHEERAGRPGRVEDAGRQIDPARQDLDVSGALSPQRTRRGTKTPFVILGVLGGESAVPEPDWTEAGRKLFAGPCDFFYAAARSDGLPPVGAPEVAFAGRSNVGKSSLINALTGRNALARTSHTPGRTQELIFFDLGGKADAGRHAGLRLRRRVEGEVRLLGQSGARLSARPSVAPARVRPDRRPPRAEGQRPRDDDAARRLRRLLRCRADQARRGQARRPPRPGRGDAGGAAQARRSLSRRDLHLGARRRRRAGAARSYRETARGARGRRQRASGVVTAFFRVCRG